MILGIDVGGTLTDAVLVGNYQVKAKAKVLTDNTNIMAIFKTGKRTFS